MTLIMHLYSTIHNVKLHISKPKNYINYALLCIVVVWNWSPVQKLWKTGELKHISLLKNCRCFLNIAKTTQTHTQDIITKVQHCLHYIHAHQCVNVLNSSSSTYNIFWDICWSLFHWYIKRSVWDKYFITSRYFYIHNRIWWLCLIRSSTTRYGSELWVQNGQTFNRVIQEKYFFMKMTSNSLTYNEEYDIPSQILKTILDCMPNLLS